MLKAAQLVQENSIWNLNCDLQLVPVFSWFTGINRGYFNALMIWATTIILTSVHAHDCICNYKLANPIASNFLRIGFRRFFIISDLLLLNTPGNLYEEKVTYIVFI